MGGGGGGFQTFLCLFLVLFSSIISLSNAYSFKVGGKDGWTLNPSENYNTWSKRQRFVINDTITFKYPKGSDSVLAVTKDDYDNCNINNPITKMEDGDSVFKLDRSGPFYFVSGNKSNCDQGQKLALVVISPRGQPKSNPPMASPPSPIAITPVSSPPSPAIPATAPAAITPGSSPTSPEIPATPRVSSPPSPAIPATAPAAITPGSSPTSPEIPAMPPVSSPPSPAIPATAPAAITPGPSPTSPEIPSTPSTGSKTPMSSVPGPSGAPVAPVAPPPASFAAAFTPSVVLVASVCLVMALGSFTTTY